jgi:hypothetical protein
MCKNVAINFSILSLIKSPLFLILVAIENRKLGRHKKTEASLFEVLAAIFSVGAKI